MSLQQIDRLDKGKRLFHDLLPQNEIQRRNDEEIENGNEEPDHTNSNILDQQVGHTWKRHHIWNIKGILTWKMSPQTKMRSLITPTPIYSTNEVRQTSKRRRI